MKSMTFTTGEFKEIFMRNAYCISARGQIVVGRQYHP